MVWLFVLAIFVLVMFISKIINRFNRPKEKAFRCGRCGKTDNHNSRTINAWRNGKKKYFCSTCHQKWLKTKNIHPSQNQPSYKTSGSGGSGVGCLPIIIIGFLISFTSIYSANKNQSNQQVDPVVTTPVDEVEAHFTRLLSDIRIKRI